MSPYRRLSPPQYGELAALCDLDVDFGLVSDLLPILDLLHDFVALETNRILEP